MLIVFQNLEKIKSQIQILKVQGAQVKTVPWMEYGELAEHQRERNFISS